MELQNFECFTGVVSLMDYPAVSKPECDSNNPECITCQFTGGWFWFMKRGSKVQISWLCKRVWLWVQTNKWTYIYNYSLSWFQIRCMVEALPWPQAHLRFLWQMDVPEVQAKSTFFVVPAFWNLRSNDIEKRI